jgi:Putative beta barrel porin-7 (BBP7)
MGRAAGSPSITLNANGGSISTTTTTVATLNNAGKTVKSVTTTTTTPTVGGLYTNPNNIGTFDNCGFSVVPQLEFKLGYDLTNHLRATVGYDAMFWTNVLRPGNQISNFVGAGPLNNGSNVWVQGFNVGLEYRW